MLLFIHGNGLRPLSFVFGIYSETVERKLFFQHSQSVLMSPVSEMELDIFFSLKAEHRPSILPLE